jgi:hypothetical protein
VHDVVRKVVGYTGEGRVRRPIYSDEGPASARVDGIAAIGRLSALDLRGVGAPIAGAGPVERRQISEAERDVRRGREALPSPIARVLRAPAPPQPTQEAQMTVTAEPGQDMTTESPPVPLSAIRERLEELSAAAAELAEATEVRAEAALGCLVAERRLDAAWTALRAPDEPVATMTVLPVEVTRSTTVRAMTNEEREAQSRRNGTKAMMAGREAKKAASAAAGGHDLRPGTEERARAVLAALERHNGNTKAAGEELGLRGNVVAIIAKHARARQAAETPEVPA